jgi:hypothetical protein
VSEKIGPRLVSETRVELGQQGGSLHEIRLIADQLDHFLQQIAVRSHVEGRVVQTNQVAVFWTTTEVRVGGLEATGSGTVLTGIDQGLDGPHFLAEFDLRHVSLKTMMPFSARNRHLA